MPTTMYTEDEFNAIVARAETAEAAIEAIRRAAGVPSQPAHKAATVARVTVHPSKWREVADHIAAASVPGEYVGSMGALATRYSTSSPTVKRALEYLASEGTVYRAVSSAPYTYR
jgi:hypothetical protein